MDKESGQNLQQNCSKHDKLQKDFILVKQNVEDHLICFKCIQENNIIPQQVVYTKELVGIEDDYILRNYPPLEDESLSNYLNDLNQKQNKLSTITDKINKYYEQLKLQMEAAIELKKNETKQKIINLQDLREQIMKVYNEISSKQQLKNIIKNKEKNMNTEIQQIIQDKFDNMSSYTQKIKEKIQSYRILKDSLCFNLPEKIHTDILALLQKIDFFCNINLNAFQEYIQQKENNSTSNNKEKQKNNCGILLELVKNPTNYCTQQCINSLENMLNKYSFMFNQIHFEDQILCNFEKKNIFCSLNQEQLENVRELSKKILTIEKQDNQNNNEFINKDIQNNSYTISNIIDQHALCDSRDLKILLKRYPIFEITNYFQLNSINTINFIKAQGYQSSQQQNINKTPQYIEIQKTTSPNNAISYTDFILDQKKKYIFRIKIQSNSNQDTFINIGLIKEQTKNTIQLYNNGLTYIERGDAYNGISKSIKGGYVYEGSKKNINKEIEMRIDLENKILKVATYPNYDNVAQLEDKSKIEDNQQYRLATELFHLEHKIIITHFAIVDEFDHKM